MKKIIAIITFTIVLMILAGCRNDGQHKSKDSSKSNGQSADELPIADINDINSVQNSDALPIADINDINGVQNSDELLVADKIVVITYSLSGNIEASLNIKALKASYGEDRVIHMAWPSERSEEAITRILQEVSEDPGVRALVLDDLYRNRTLLNELIKNVRDDIFVVYTPSIYWSLPSDVDPDLGADLIIWTDLRRRGESYVTQAKSMGADTIVHYSFPREYSEPAIAIERDAMKTTAEREGVRFIEVETIDPYSDVFYDILPDFIYQDLPRQVESLGENTTFYGTSYLMQQPILSQVIATKAIFVNTDCLSSPYEKYPEVLGIECEIRTDEKDDNGLTIKRQLEPAELVRAIDEAVDNVGMAGRISGWVVSDSTMWRTIGFKYAVEWLDGNVPQERGVIDIDTLRRLAREYTTQLSVDADVTLEAITHDGAVIERYIQGIVDYHVYGN
jgi:hypothetical protein